jgi:STAS-like domain of unknown function (DUF4325)
MLGCVSEDSLMKIRPADTLGAVLTGRSIAAALRAEVEEHLRSDEEVILDFENVAAISPSFADELFAKLPTEAWKSKRVIVEHLDEDSAAFARILIANRD